MSSTLFYYTLIPMLSIWLSAVLTVAAKPKGLFVNIMQAFSAGIILASVALTLLPHLTLSGHLYSISISVLAGLALMLLLKRLNPDCCHSDNNTASLTPFLTAFAIEFFMNGVLITLAGTASHTTALLIAISLAICCFICSATVASRLTHTGMKRARAIVIVMLMGALTPLAGLLSMSLLPMLTTTCIDMLLAFGIAILLYIATADLLLGAYKSKSDWVPIGFFIGFLVIIITATLL